MATRRPPGAGSIYRRSRDGLWVAAITLSVTPRRRKVFTARTRELLLDRLAVAGVTIDDSHPVAQGRLTAMSAARELGRHTGAEWNALVRTSPRKCPYCGVPLNLFNRTKDHKVPVARGGSDAIDNLEPICWECNASKGDRTHEEFVYTGPRPRDFRPHPLREKEYLRVLARAS
jgi:5-methylcytosine-specific restriction endonuclease McrA